MRDLAELIDAATARDGDAVAVSEDEAITYASLRTRVECGARRLAEAGVGARGRVGLMAPNGAAFVAGFLAIVRAGGVVVPLNDRYRRDDLLQLVGSSDLDALVTARELADLGREVVRTSSRRLPVLEADALVAPGDLSPLERPPIDPRDPVLLQFSSGSTGTPKRIVRTHENLLAELAALRSVLEIVPGDRFLGAAPFSHVNGLVRTMLSSLYAGAALYPVPGFDRRAVAQRIERDRITVFIAVPFMFTMLAQAHYRRTPDFGSLRLCISASAPMPATHNELFLGAFGLWVRQLYGSTETGSISVNMDPDVASSLESVGTPLPGVEIAVFRDDGTAAGAGEVGEVAVRSPFAIVAYDHDEEANRTSFQGGWFLTGDLGARAASGRLTLRGRKKLQINKGGHKIDPVEIERVLEEHPRVMEAAVVGVPSAYGDDRVKAVIVTSGPCGPEDIIAHCRPRIADFKIPSVIEFRDALPKSPTGKVRRALLQGPAEAE